jgi:CheY-like chemotaxis protein
MNLPARSVLYAEDDENDAFFMERAFRRLHLADALEVVPDGQKAVARLEAEIAPGRPDGAPALRLLLLDVKMPHRTGLEVLEWARQRPEFQHLPIVIITSSTQEKDVAAAAAHGANAYLVKPSNAENLIAVVKRLLQLATETETPPRRFAIEGNQLSGG